MTQHGIASKVAVSLAFVALSAMTGCADLNDDDSQRGDELASHNDEPELAAQSTQPSASNIAITGITASGSGCPSGSWTVDKSDPSALTITFEKYGINAPPTSTTKLYNLACNVSLSVRTPKNLSYAVHSFQYFGYAQVGAKQKASFTANYAYTGFGIANGHKEYRKDFPAGYEGNFILDDQVTARGNAPSWAPCNVTTNLQVRTRLNYETTNQTMPGLLSLDNLDLHSEASLKINFRTGPCPLPTSSTSSGTF